MRRCIIMFMVAVLLAILASSASARDIRRQQRKVMRPWTAEEFRDPILEDQGIRGMQKSAAADTYRLVWFDFEQLDWQGWTRVDNTAQIDTFFHIEDFAEPGLGSGKLAPIQGSYSMWCGAHEGICGFSNEYMCGWEDPTGYGNGWDQMLESDDFVFTGPLTLSYHAFFDTETGYDEVLVEYDAGGGDWRELPEGGSWDGRSDEVVVSSFLINQVKTKLRFHFTSDGAWSDEDGLWTTDGAVIIDSITVADDTGVIHYEDFEGGSDCDRGTAFWQGKHAEPFGKYSGLANNLDDLDPCGYNYGTQIVFFKGSGVEPANPYPSWLWGTPFCQGEGGVSAPCQDEAVISPPIDMTRYSTNYDEYQDADIPAGDLTNLGGALLKFSVYRDLPIQNLVFYNWQVRDIENGCPGDWMDRGFGYYGADYYHYSMNEIGDLVSADTIQVKLEVVDMCDSWYLTYGDCAEHTPAPYFDDVRVERYSTAGPRWYSRSVELFQDNFPEEEFDWQAVDAYIRADGAQDLNSDDNPVIRPADSAVVYCNAPLAGSLGTAGNGRAEIYMHVRAVDIGGNGKPNLYGSQLEGTYGSYQNDDGILWTVIQCDSARTAGGNIAGDRYMVDLNDSLFTCGYQISYYFEATDADGVTSRYPDPDKARTDEERYFEWTCLPTTASDILYVDDFHARGSIQGITELYWNMTFKDVLPDSSQPDRYDVNSSYSGASNGPASRVRLQQLMDAYEVIIWDSGNLDYVTICDGTMDTDKSNDCQLLVDWMNLSEHNTGLWINGDGVAEELGLLPSASSAALLNTWCGVDPVNYSYYGLTGGYDGGGVVYPGVRGAAVSSVYSHGDSLYLSGGCPLINSFDVLDKTGNGEYALHYPAYNSTSYYAAIESEKVNEGGYTARTMWHGFSWRYVRDGGNFSPRVRSSLAKKVFEWMKSGSTRPDITGGEVPASYRLAQNFPNPFNPATTIRFDIREKGNVSLKIYNVAGQLVKTLVNEVRDAGSYNENWNGTNDTGSRVSSGVYFYKIESGNFTATRKMVLLR